MNPPRGRNGDNKYTETREGSKTKHNTQGAGDWQSKTGSVTMRKQHRELSGATGQNTYLSGLPYFVYKEIFYKLAFSVSSFY